MKGSTVFPVPLGISARHVHLSQDHVIQLFGSDLHPDRDLSQKGEYAALERVTLVGPGRVIQKVRVLGPPRRQTQVEVAGTDAIALGIKVPVRLSGNLAGTPGLTLVGTVGAVTLKEGLIIAARHLHIPPMEASRYGLMNNQKLQAGAGQARRVIFDEVVVRIASTAVTEIHLDTDESNAAGLSNSETMRVIVPEHESGLTASQPFICVEDIQELVLTGRSLTLSEGQRITPAARELARARGILIQ